MTDQLEELRAAMDQAIAHLSVPPDLVERSRLAGQRRRRRHHLLAGAVTVVMIGVATAGGAMFAGIGRPAASRSTVMPSLHPSSTPSLHPSSTPSAATTPITVTLTSPARSATCTELRGMTSVDTLVSAFRASRLRHESVTGCITTQAKAAYCRTCTDRSLDASPGPLCLYGCGDPLKDLQVQPGQSRRLANGTYYVALVEILRRPSGHTVQQPEYLIVRPRKDGRLIVTEAAPN